MRYEYDPGLIEQAVFLAVRCDAAVERELHADLDPIHTIEDAGLRDEQFGQVHARWFTRLGLDRPIHELASEQPLIRQRVSGCLVRRAGGRRREGADLLVRQTAAHGSRAYTLIVELLPESLLDTERVTALLRRDLFKVADMLDDSFGYSPDLPEGPLARRNLIRDRYCALWDFYVEVRLAARGRSDPSSMHRVRASLDRAFTLGGSPLPAVCFDALPSPVRLTHSRLMDWACNPKRLPGLQNDPDADPARGGACPICGFPTHDWHAFDAVLDRDLIRAIRQARPYWTVNLGVCRRCVETLRVRSGGLPIAPRIA